MVENSQKYEIQLKNWFLTGRLSAVTLAVITIVVLNLICHWRATSGYFLADDFIHVSYLFDVFHGHAMRLLENFTGNWMQTTGTQFYRPLISLTLALDYWLGGGAAFPFHLSNVLYQIASSVLLFLTTRQLLQGYHRNWSIFAAFVAGALFAVFPIHCEVVNWIIARVDSVCLMFFLGACWLYLRAAQQNSVWSRYLAIGSFVLSLLSKEPAVVLPPLLVLFELVCAGDKEKAKGFPLQVVHAFRATLPYWCVLAIYFVVRTAALGTVIGGYTGSVGAGFNESILHRLFFDGSILRVFLPFNAEVFSPTDKIKKLMEYLYLLTAVALVPRLVWSKPECRGLVLVPVAAAWALLCFLPVIQVFNITETLQCSRFAYALTAPLCVLFALLLVPLSSSTSSEIKSSLTRKILQCVSVFLSVSLIGLMAVATCRNNNVWVRASEQVRQFRGAVEAELRETAGGAKLAVLNVPDRYKGAHMIYNGAMLSVLMSAPLTRTPGASERVISFEPVTYGDSNLIISSRLRQLLASDQTARPAVYWWNGAESKLIRLPIRASEKSTVMPLEFKLHRDLPADMRYVSGNLNICPWDYGFIRLRARRTPGKTYNQGTGASPGDLQAIGAPSRNNAFLQISWSNTTNSTVDGATITVPISLNGEDRTFCVPVGQFKSWIAQSQINKLVVQFRSQSAIAADYSISGSFIPQRLLMPEFTCSRTPGNDGILQVTRLLPVQAKFDVSGVSDAQTAVVEVSEPNSWFEHYSGTLRDDKFADKRLRQIKSDAQSGLISVNADEFPCSGYYQLRAFAVNRQGNVVGYSSDPINVQVSR